MKKLIIMRGLPGSGKSTKAKTLAPANQIFSTDEYWGPEYKFDKSKLRQAHQWNMDRTEDAMAKGITPVVVDNTNTRWGLIQPYANMADMYGYTMEYVESDSPWWKEITKQLEDPKVHNVNNPIFKKIIDTLFVKNTHGVPKEGLEGMTLGWVSTKDLPKQIKTFKEHIETNDFTKQLYDKATNGKMLAGFITQLDKEGKLEILLPEVKALQGKNQPASHHPEGDAYAHTISALNNSRATIPLHNIAILFHDLGKAVTHSPTDKKGNVKDTYYGHDQAGINIIEQIARRLDLSESDKKAMQFVAGRHMLGHTPDRVRDFKLVGIVTNPYWNVLKDAIYADEVSRPAPVGDKDKVLKAIEYMEGSKDRVRMKG